MLDAGFDPVGALALRMGDNALILGHRVSEWCGHAPVLEEDIALANIALDLIGQAQLWLGLAGESAGKTADELAFLRDAWDFRCLLLVEQPNGDFARTVMRQFLFDAWHVEMLRGLCASSEPRVSEIAQKAVREAEYHLERSSAQVVALGDGTEESHARMQAALDWLWPWAGEALVADPVDVALAEAGIAPAVEAVRPGWEATLGRVLGEATLTQPESDFAHRGGKDGRRHSEALGHLLCEMQWLQRAYPGATW